MIEGPCLFMALNGPERVAGQCRLLGVQRTCRAGGQTSEFDPTETLAAPNDNALDAGFWPIKVLVLAAKIPPPEGWGGAAISLGYAWSLTARALQRGRNWRIAVLMGGAESDPGPAGPRRGLRQGPSGAGAYLRSVMTVKRCLVGTGRLARRECLPQSRIMS
jgi:hypothetical protein